MLHTFVAQIVACRKPQKILHLGMQQAPAYSEVFSHVRDRKVAVSYIFIYQVIDLTQELLVKLAQRQSVNIPPLHAGHFMLSAGLQL